MSKTWVRYFLITAGCFVIDSTITFFMPFDFTKNSYMVVPYVGTMVFCFLVNHVEKEQRYLLSVLVGLYFTIVYGNSLAIFPLLYVGLAWGVNKYTKGMHFQLFEYIYIVFSTILAFETVLYLLMWFTGMTQLTVVLFLQLRFIPTVLFNLLISIVLFIIYNKVEWRVIKNVY
ncbi:rod shape-determining protein MreD [Tannockella kyphosi]|uniref:rod shape-determining protein MreD n=1 Tax=Tannockella kyphosi TaxID=2899121 RepID=UPI002011D2E2|nr:rod shape-determining protein MreD [Tannockella kyphosi]